MKKQHLLILILFVSATFSQAQRRRVCGTHDRYLQSVAEDPSLVARRAAMEERLQTWIAQHPVQRTNGTQSTLVTIPVVVHVLYYNTTQNISDAQILSQIDVLNLDYSLTNADTGLIPAAFKPVTGNPEIQFCMATVDPSGNPTNGIERRQVTTTRIGNSNKYYNYSQGGLAAWNSQYYLNFWLCDIDGGSTLGYTYLPGTVGANMDGIVIDPQYWGTIGSVVNSAPYNEGRTVTHEVGHWFNLEHIWADEPNCAADDYVSDTPQQKGENYGCPTYPRTAQSGGRCNTSDPSSMFMNYMDYTDDACMYMFTQGQVARMHAAINTQRANLFNATGCTTSTYTAESPSALRASVFPNPSEGVFEFLLSDPGFDVSLEVTDCKGSVLIKRTFAAGDKKLFDLSGFPEGIYLAHLSTGDQTVVAKVVKY